MTIEADVVPSTRSVAEGWLNALISGDFDTAIEHLSPGNKLARFCHDLLTSLTRSDQRRWGEIYIRGLLSVHGRKSVRRMSDYIVGGRADQGIQQFVNQSPWEWAPVRRDLAGHVTSMYRPDAWVINEVVLPKNGSSSAGLAGSTLRRSAG